MYQHSYRDFDEYFPNRGAINSAFVYDRALSAAEIEGRFKQGMKRAAEFCPTTTTTTTATTTTATASSTTAAHELIDQLATKVDKLSTLLDSAMAKIDALEKGQALCALQTTVDSSISDTNSKIEEVGAGVSDIDTRFKAFTNKVVQKGLDVRTCQGQSCAPSITTDSSDSAGSRGLLLQADGGEVGNNATRVADVPT